MFARIVLAAVAVVAAYAACVDLINPSTGTSDCPGAASLCNNAIYYTLMTTQCPLTCGRCSSTNSTATSTAATATATATTATGGCVDLVNPTTGISECPGAAYLCNNPNYTAVMQVQCPVTCGFC